MANKLTAKPEEVSVAGSAHDMGLPFPSYTQTKQVSRVITLPEEFTNGQVRSGNLSTTASSPVNYPAHITSNRQELVQHHRMSE